MKNINVLQPKVHHKKRIPFLKCQSPISKNLETTNNKFPEIVLPNVYVKLEKINVFEYDEQYALYGTTISKIKESHPNLILPIRINSRRVAKCPDCPYKTIYPICIKTHKKAIHKKLNSDDMFYCHHCTYSSYDKTKLLIHMVSHKLVKDIECPYCKKMFKAKHSLNSHIKLMHNEVANYHCCDTCSYKSKTRQGLVNHKQRIHVPDSDRKEKFSCTLCQFTTNKQWTLQSHIRSQHTKLFSCSKCSFSTPLADSFEQHQCKLYECSKCDYKTHRITVFKIHCTSHRKREELPLLTCPFCPFTTTSPSSLSSHRTDHRLNKGVQCPECQLTLKKRSLAKHMKTKHFIKKDDWHACSSCDYKTTNFSNLGRHIEGKHSNKSDMETLRCEKCDFETKSKASLYMHVKCIHSNSAYKCDQCGFTTIHRGNFMEHIKIHTERKTVACEKCSKTFLSKSLLKSHMKRIHEEGKTYICEMCPKGFQKLSKTKACFKRHMLRHKTKSELETFKCYDCPYEAKIKSELAKHIRLIHINNKEKYHICPKCYYRAKHKESLEKHIKEMHKKV